MDWITNVLEFFESGDWLAPAAVFGGTVLVLRAVQWFTRWKLSRIAERTEAAWDDHLVAALGNTRLVFIVVVGLYAASLTLELRPAWASVLETAAIIAVILQCGLWLALVLRRMVEAQRREAEEEEPGRIASISMIGFLLRLGLWSTVLLLVLDNLGIDITALVAGLGIGGVALALAVQSILGDLFASLSIVLDEPFVVGDFLMVGDFLGSVEKIGIKTTRLRSLSGEQLVFSNNDLLTSRIRNFGRMAERRVVFKLGVTYQTPREKLERIPALIREAVEAQGNARFDRSHFAAYGDFSLNFETVFYVLSADYNEYMDIQQAIYFAVHEAFEEEGIEFAYPTRTLFLKREGEEAPSSA